MFIFSPTYCLKNCLFWSWRRKKRNRAKSWKANDTRLVYSIYVATMQEKVFLGSDDSLWYQKNRQIQWNEGFFISTVAFWEKRDLLTLILFYFPCPWCWAPGLATGLNLLKIIWKVPRFEFKCCDDCYFCQLLCQF